MVTENLELRKAIYDTIPKDHHSEECRQWSMEAIRAIAAIYLYHANGNKYDAAVGYSVLCKIGRTMIAMGVKLDTNRRET